MVSLSLYGHLEIHLQTMVVFLIRVRLDVDIGDLDIELGQIPNQTSIGIELQYQRPCLDEMKLLDGILWDKQIQFTFGCAKDGIFSSNILHHPTLC